MCRFFIYWGNKPVALSQWLITADNCLLEQSRNDMSARPNPDGWGFAYHQGDKIILAKNTEPAFKDSRFQMTSEKIISDLLFAHVRRRSQGTVSYENTHPFVYENWIFMHNGNIPNFEHYKQRLALKLPPNSFINTEGTTDSEFLFKYFIYWLGQMNNCDIYCMINLINSIIHELIELSDRATLNELALNFVLTNGHFVLGFRRNRTLYYSFTDDSLLIASEKINRQYDWNEVPENHFIVAPSPGEVQLAAYNIELKKQSLSLV